MPNKISVLKGSKHYAVAIAAKSFPLGKQFTTAITQHTREDRKGEVYSLGNNLTKDQMYDSRQTCFESVKIVRTQDTLLELI